VLRELAEECTLEGEVAELLLEGDHGGRHAWYFRVTGVEGEPVLGGEEAEHQDGSNLHQPMWASPVDLELMGLLPEGMSALVVGWLWPLRVERADTDADWKVVERLWQPYSHDLSEFRGTTPGPDGTYRRGHLQWYGPDDPDAAAYVARLGDRPVGFALVRGLEGDKRTMGEFFLVRAARGGGHARTFAEHVVGAHPGPWEIAFQEDNAVAARFWRRLGAEVLTGAAEEPRGVPNKPYIPPDVWMTGMSGG
jgi:predicted acetyltransferase